MSGSEGHLQRILREFREALRAKVPPGVSLVDELIAERREESEGEWDASRTGHGAKDSPTAK